MLSRIDGRDAGYLVDDYYRYQYPQYYDGRYRDYNAYLSDPYYSILIVETSVTSM